MCTYSQLKIAQIAHSTMSDCEPWEQLRTKRYLLDSDLSGPVVPTSSRHVITHGLTKGNSIGVEIGTV